MTLNGRYALCCRKDASFGAHHKKLNEDRPIPTSAKMQASVSSLFSRYKVYGDIRGGSLGRGRQMIVWLSRTAIFSIFAGYFSDTLEIRPTLLYSDTQSVVGISVISKSMTLNGYFALNSVFAPVWLADTVRLSKNNCVKTNKDRHILSATQILGRDSSFWQYKSCADIWSGSLERRSGVAR